MPKLEWITKRPDPKRRWGRKSNTYVLTVDGTPFGELLYLSSSWSVNLLTPARPDDEDHVIYRDPATSRRDKREFASREQAEAALVRAALLPEFVRAHDALEAARVQLGIVRAIVEALAKADTSAGDKAIGLNSVGLYLSAMRKGPLPLAMAAAQDALMAAEAIAETAREAFEQQLRVELPSHELVKPT